MSFLSFCSLESKRETDSFKLFFVAPSPFPKSSSRHAFQSRQPAGPPHEQSMDGLPQANSEISPSSAASARRASSTPSSREEAVASTRTSPSPRAFSRAAWEPPSYAFLPDAHHGHDSRPPPPPRTGSPTRSSSSETESSSTPWRPP